MPVVIQDDMLEAASAMTRKQGDDFLVALLRYGSTGEEPKGKPAWLPTFIACRARIDMSKQASEKARRMAEARYAKQDARSGCESDANQDAEEDCSSSMHKQDARAACTDEPKQDAQAGCTCRVQQQGTESESESESESEKNTPQPPRAKRFVPPTVGEVRAYVAERGYHIDPEAFVAYYASKGWVVGRSPMRSWRAACATWERRNGGGGGSVGDEYSAL